MASSTRTPPTGERPPQGVSGGSFPALHDTADGEHDAAHCGHSAADGEHDATLCGAA